MVSIQFGKVGYGLLMSVGPPGMLSAVAYGLAGSATTLNPADPQEFSAYVKLSAAILIFSWMIGCVGRGLAALGQRRYEWGSGLLIGSAMPIVAYLLLAA